MKHTSGAEALPGNAGNRQACIEQAHELIVGQTAWILSAARAVGDANDARVLSKVTEEDAQEVAAHVSIWAAGHLDGKGLGGWVNATVAQGDIQEHHNTFRSDTILLVIDASQRLRAHEGCGHRVATDLRLLDDPIDVLRNHLLVRTEVDQLLHAEVIDHMTSDAFVGHNEVEQRVGEGLHRIAQRMVSVNLGRLGDVDQDDSFSSTLRDVLVLQFLSARERIDLIVTPG
mmetsp:Transcript_27322/g.63686  ORF Transcript_27322/g.63686 Transcript_27322/m.63686 type:complete len:230 (+) Transcript_27322:1218-1907(+)